MNYYSVYTIDSDPYIRLDKASTNCTKGKTIKCGNVCRKPENCKQKTGGQYKGLLAQKREKMKQERLANGMISSHNKKQVKSEASKMNEIKPKNARQVSTIVRKAGIPKPEYFMSSRVKGAGHLRKPGVEIKTIGDTVNLFFKGDKDGLMKEKARDALRKAGMNPQDFGESIYLDLAK